MLIDDILKTYRESSAWLGERAHYMLDEIERLQEEIKWLKSGKATEPMPAKVEAALMKSVRARKKSKAKR